LSELPG